MPGPELLLTTRDQIPVGEGRAFMAGGREIAVFHTHDGALYATQAHCPHRNGPLADGLTGGKTIMCPLHDRTFDLATGCGISHTDMSIATYPIRLTADGEVWLDLSTLAAEPETASR